MVHTGHVVNERYRLLRRLGSGGMGVVWLATDEVLHREVALKQIPLTGMDAAQAELVGRRLRREARTSAMLHHPNIVSIFDVVLSAEAAWLVLEYVPARSLSDLVGESGPMPPAAVATIGTQIAAALARAHDVGITHRDVKPANVLVTGNGVAKLADFGTSQVVDDPTITPPGLISGTPMYFAPEVAGGSPAGSPADLFALGSTLYTAVEGGSPFQHHGFNMQDLLDQIQCGNYRSPKRAGPLLPVLTRLLALHPDDRPTAGQARALLAAVAEGAAPEPPARSRRLPWVAGLAAVLVAVLVGTVLALTDGTVPGTPGRAEPANPPPGSPTPAGAVGLDDPRLADPCSLLDVGAVAGFGELTVRQDYGGFDDCRGTVASRDIEVALTAEFQPSLPAGGALPDGAQRLSGGIAVGRAAPAETSCQREVALGDRTRFDITVQLAEGGSAPVCRIADAATQGALRAVRTGRVRQRQPAPADSLRRVDACALLDGARMPAGLSVSRGQPAFGNWRCIWGDPDDPQRPAVQVLFYQRPPPSSVLPGRYPKRMGDRQGFLVPGGYDESRSCVAEITQTPFTTRTGEARVELVLLTVFGPGSPDALCRTASELMTDSVAGLPG